MKPNRHLKKHFKMWQPVFSGTQVSEHVTPVVCSVQWHPTEYRIQFIISVLIFKAIVRKSPKSYLLSKSFLKKSLFSKKSLSLQIMTTHDNYYIPLELESSQPKGGLRRQNLCCKSEFYSLNQVMRMNMDFTTSRSKYKTHFFNLSFFK